MHISKLDDIVDKYNNTYHSAICITLLVILKMKKCLERFMKKIAKNKAKRI